MKFRLLRWFKDPISNVCNRVQFVDQQELGNRIIIQRHLINPDIAQIFEGSISFP